MVKGSIILEYKLINEQTFMIYFNNQIDRQTFQKVQQVEQYIKDQQHDAIVEVIPSYRAIMVNVDITQQNVKQVIDDLQLDQLDESQLSMTDSRTRVINLPVVYGGQYGQDIEEVANYNDITVDEVISKHTKNAYLIYMLGFMPGFPFLGGLDEALHTPRRTEPRTRIDAGSVGIANNQTGLYPTESPGGWQIIGRTPIKVFDLNRNPMCLYEPGDYLKFYAIDEATYEQILDEMKQSDFNIEKWVKVQYEH